MIDFNSLRRKFDAHPGHYYTRESLIVGEPIPEHDQNCPGCMFDLFGPLLGVAEEACAYIHAPNTGSSCTICRALATLAEAVERES